jgi:hypothetical protein
MAAAHPPETHQDQLLPLTLSARFSAIRKQTVAATAPHGRWSGTSIENGAIVMIPVNFNRSTRGTYVISLPYKTEFRSVRSTRIICAVGSSLKSRHSMSHVPIVGDDNRSMPMVRAAVNKFVHLSTFGVIWGLTNMIVVNFIFDRACNEHPFPVLQLLNAVL